MFQKTDETTVSIQFHEKKNNIPIQKGRKRIEKRAEIKLSTENDSNFLLDRAIFSTTGTKQQPGSQFS